MNARFHLAATGVFALLACQTRTPDEKPSSPSTADSTSSRPTCSGAPGWSALQASCVENGYVYAVAFAETLPNRAMSLHLAGDRARAALSAEVQDEIAGSEILDLSTCEAGTWALARRRLESGDDAGSPCPNGVSERSTAPEGCPKGFGALSTLKENEITGVGFVSNVNNPELAKRVAINRAVLEQRKTLRLRVAKKPGGGLETASAGTDATIQEKVESFECLGMTVARVQSRILR